MWSAVLDTILITLRYLAPATLLTLFWGQQSFIFRILRHIDLAIRAVIFSSDEEKQSVLKWLGEAGSVRVEHLDTVWRHGWILCGVLDTALPGSCGGHPPTRQSLKHAQNIADQYLGVEPVFTQQEFESSDCLSKHQEWKLAQYLDRVRKAILKIPPSVSKSNPKIIPNKTVFTLDYVARGSGLTAAQINHKTFFKVYPTSQQSLEPGEIKVLIKGPKDTYGMIVIPPILGKAQKIRKKLQNMKNKTNVTENALPFTQGATYLRSYGRTDINKTYYIPKTKYDIEIDMELNDEYARICYVATMQGKYEICIESKGQSIVGSPFRVTASKNIVGILERESFCLEDGEEIDIVDVKTDRKVVLRIVDFVTEKMLLNENGTLEKISNEEANKLIESKLKKEDTVLIYKTNSNLENTVDEDSNELIEKSQNNQIFKKVAINIIRMIKVCKLFYSGLNQNDLINKNIMPKIKDSSTFINSSSSYKVPDIVDSTYNKTFLNHCSTKKGVDESFCASDVKSTTVKTQQDYKNIIPDCEEDLKIIPIINTILRPRNPFLEGINEESFCEETLFATDSIEKSDTSDTSKNKSIKIVIDEDSEATSVSNTNPFIVPELIERPKTPVLKIITGEAYDRKDSIYVNSKYADATKMFTESNECINPFFVQTIGTVNDQNSVTDFIIGAPVSLPPVVQATSPTFGTVIFREMEENTEKMYKKEAPDNSLVFCTPHIDHNSSCTTFHSIESDVLEDEEDPITEKVCDLISDEVEIVCNNKDLQRRDIWDSAYVSIDDNNSSPDSNNNDNSDICASTSNSKQTVSNLHDNRIRQEDLSCLGPAEIELWSTCTDLKTNIQIANEGFTLPKCENSRSKFTPILEENERSMSVGLKETQDPVMEAFAELDEIFQEYNFNSEQSSLTPNYDDKVVFNSESEYSMEKNDVIVKSASEFIADVTRLRNEGNEGKISEVQANVTESISASQVLQNNLHCISYNTDMQYSSTAFGKENKFNIVLEKKKYWDEKIRHIEQSRSEEAKRRKLISKNTRHNDSLNKRRGKKVIKQILAAENRSLIKYIKCDSESVPESNIARESSTTDIKLVKKWKRFWDDKLENEHELPGFNISCKGRSPSPTKIDENIINNVEDYHSSKTDNSTPRQDLPEEIYKAFETSPKRFFGTSRNQILHKIDSFLIKPGLEENTVSTKEKGIVSNRISLFHNISHVEELVSKPKLSEFRKKKSKSNSQAPIHITNTNINNESYIESQIPVNEAYNKDLSKDKTKKPSAVIRPTFTKLLHNEQNQMLTSKYNTTKEIEQTNICNKVLLRKTLISKSEMDIFNKTKLVDINDDLDKHKSYDELPKTNVKSFISMYENVLQNVKPEKSIESNIISKRLTHSHSKTLLAERSEKFHINNNITACDKPVAPPRKKRLLSLSPISLNHECNKKRNMNEKDNRNMLKSYEVDNSSEIDVEIIEKSPSPERLPASNKTTKHFDYKSRFKLAKQYFQSLEELRDDPKKTPKLNECQQLLYKNLKESPEKTLPDKKKSNIKKSRSLPSSEFARIWNEMKNNEEIKLVKISDKFNVDDLFTDVVEGKLSRQGSLRGIPHKKAVLEALKSMENVADNKLSSYEMAIKQLTEFAKENKIKNAQTYLSEYPYLPKTDPSKYHSRIDAKASGLISRKELLNTDEKQRRNSVPDMRLNPKFIVDL